VKKQVEPKKQEMYEVVNEERVPMGGKSLSKTEKVFS